METTFVATGSERSDDMGDRNSRHTSRGVYGARQYSTIGRVYRNARYSWGGKHSEAIYRIATIGGSIAILLLAFALEMMIK